MSKESFKWQVHKQSYNFMNPISMTMYRKRNIAVLQSKKKKKQSHS